MSDVDENMVCQECGAEGTSIGTKKSNKSKEENKMKNPVQLLPEVKARSANKKEEVKEVKVEKIQEVKVEVVPEVKVEKIPEVKTKNEDSVLEYEKASKIISREILINPDLKIVETSNASGNSYFSGKTRLFKLIKSKRGVSLEINVQLPKDLCKDLPGMEDISIATAHAKHLGTMKHHYRSSDSKEIERIIHAIIVEFKRNITKKEEAKITIAI
jgi:hypothetical protein